MTIGPEPMSRIFLRSLRRGTVSQWLEEGQAARGVILAIVSANHQRS